MGAHDAGGHNEEGFQFIQARCLGLAFIIIFRAKWVMIQNRKRMDMPLVRALMKLTPRAGSMRIIAEEDDKEAAHECEEGGAWGGGGLPV